MSAASRTLRARYVVYTDGGASPNPGNGGWGAVLLDSSTGECRELSGSEPETTNNRMELTAAIEGLGALPEGSAVDLYTDSRYLRQGITQWIDRWIRQGWQRKDRSGQKHPVKNVDLWRRLADLETRYRVEWHWVKGHAGDRYNERADELASSEIERLSASQPDRTSRKAAASSSDLEATIKVACQRGRGAWAFHLAAANGDREPEVWTGARTETTANRLELEAALDVLERVDPTVTLAFRSGDYLRRGAAEWLAGWKQRGWKTGSGEPVKNVDLWRKIDREIGRRTVEFLPLDRDGKLEKELARAAKAAR